MVAPAQAAGRGEPGPVFPVAVSLLDEEADLLLLQDLDLDIDGVFDGWARVHVIAEELWKLRRQGFTVTLLPEEKNILAARAGAGGAAGNATEDEGIDAPPPKYHTYATLTSDLQEIADDHPDIVRLVSIGQSVQGRELWMMKITANPDVEEFEPEVAYIAAMHGDEVVGKEMCFFLIDLITDEYGIDPRITDLVDGTEIWIMPSMNPDGTELGQRYNASGIDLNRDFPDQFVDPVNTPDGRAVETGLVMTWGAAHSTNLAGTFHGGALVANYSYDSNPAGQSVYSPSPDEGVFVSAARTYADNNPSMVLSNGHPSYNNGICNGADWYSIHGGIQDWNYVWRGAKDLTLELSNTKWPDARELTDFWDDNRESMLAYLERVHEGVRGLVTDALTGLPLAAAITVQGNDRTSYADPDLGDFHRTLLPGRYTLEVSAVGYRTEIVDVVVPPGDTTRRDVALAPLDTDLRPVAGCVERTASLAGQGDGTACERWLDTETSEDLVVTLRNLGLAATSVAGDLVPAGWFAEVTRSGAAYPDLPPGASGGSVAPHHGVSVSPSVPAGHRVGLALRWSAAEGAGLSAPFWLPVGAPQCDTVTATDVPAAILDRSTTTSETTAAFERELDFVRVAVDISHTYRGDLTVTLVSPAGSPVILHDRSGGSADDLLTTYDDDPDGTGETSPFESFARLRGESSLGAWQLRVNDGRGGDQGSIEGWSIELCGRPFETATPEVRLHTVAGEAGDVRLDWWPYPGLESYRVYRSNDPSSAGAFSDVTGEDPDTADTVFLDASTEPLVFWLVTGVGPNGEGPKGHFGE